MENQDESREHRHSFGYWLRQFIALPGAALAYAVGKWKAMSASDVMIAEAVPLFLSPSATAKLMSAWSKPLVSANSSAWSEEELELIARIKSETYASNRNNVTRTEAYRVVYFRSPELHWALLAHLVSRNGGWNMTDLQGEWLPLLLRPEQRESVFQFLEQANAFIFQDAYPQLLLYEWSRREGRSLFHLLPAFGVSVFMTPVWKLFWRERDSVPLTIALIVNEQHYIEKRIVQHPYFREKVLHTLFFGLQSVLQLNGVIFPYGGGQMNTNGGGKEGCGVTLESGRGRDNSNGLRREQELGVGSKQMNKAKEPEPLRLAGLILERFEQLEERIEFGKQLYAMLFGIPRVYDGARCFAAAVKHTGSRADYAPHLFARVRQQPPKRVYEERLLGGKLKPGAEPIYSPELNVAWNDRPLELPEPGDWFQTAAEIAPYFQKLSLPHSFEMTNEYGLMLNKIELAVLAMQRDT